MSQHTILFARRYSFTSPQTGEILSGVKISYLDNQRDDSKDTKGISVLSINAPLEIWNCLEVVPGKYDLAFRHKMDSKTNKPVAVLQSLNYIYPDANDNDSMAA